MRSTTLILLLALLAATQAHAVKSVTVQQLSGEVASFGKQSDAKVAERLFDLQLTERLSANKLASFESVLPGPESRRALVALADQAEFLDPPPAEIPNQPAPSVAQQREIIAKSIGYVEAALHRMPNLFANRDTIRFEDFPPGLRDESTDTMVPFQPLHPVSRSVETVLYQDGQELVQKPAAQPGGANPASTGMMTSGEFGPIFPVVYGDLPKGNLRWSRWQQGETGPEAVFGFNVPKAASHYQVKFCCIRGGLVFQEFSAYHGELRIDPANGTILRMMLIADLEKGAEIAAAELIVEYAPVEVGGKKYFCPVRSISVSRAPGQIERITPVHTRILSMDQVTSSNEAGEAEPLQTMLNETTFDNYHLFRADAQILSAGNSGGGSPPSTPADASSKSLTSPSATLAPQANAAAASAAPPTTQLSAVPAEPSAAAAPPPADRTTTGENAAGSTAASLTALQPSAGSSAPASSAAEMAVVAPASLPQTPLPAPSGKPGFALKVNTRLVDVDVTAFDQKGHPVAGLSMKDFEIYDNGRKESLRSFSKVAAAPAVSQAPVTSALPVLYSNRLDAIGPARSAGASAPGSSTILLLDESSVGFFDLNYARQQILKFLDRLPESQPVALYLRTGPGFRILAEETTDHAALSSVLRKWVPTAQDLQRAQEEETRTRQSFDYVDFPDELQYVNGNMGGMEAPTSDPLSTVMMNYGGNTTPDPKLSKEGQTPQRDALAALIGVAANLNAIPGHKNLVWVASDNVLANWSDQAPGNERGPNTIDAFNLGIEEALNDAHVSLYPLDVSQLETSTMDPSLRADSVGLNPAFVVPSGAPPTPVDGRGIAEMQQDTHAVRLAIQHLAQATGGQSFRRSSNMLGELDSVIADGDGAYLLSFSPDTSPTASTTRSPSPSPRGPGLNCASVPVISTPKNHRRSKTG